MQNSLKLENKNNIHAENLVSPVAHLKVWDVVSCFLCVLLLFIPEKYCIRKKGYTQMMFFVVLEKEFGK